MEKHSLPLACAEPDMAARNREVRAPERAAADEPKRRGEAMA